MQLDLTCKQLKQANFWYAIQDSPGFKCALYDSFKSSSIDASYFTLFYQTVLEISSHIPADYHF